MSSKKPPSPDRPISLIVGLCNPGKQYEATRHNVGAWLVERVASHYRASLARSKFAQGLIASVPVSELPKPPANPTPNPDKPSQDSSQPRKLHLLLPETFMNLSGQSVRATLDFLKLSIQELIVIHDELDLSPGILKLKFGGGHAGHNGIKNITQMLGTDQFWRLRVGIGHPRNNSEAKSPNQAVADYVLQPPTLNDQIRIDHAIDRILVNLPLIIHAKFADAAKQLHTVDQP